MSKNYAKIGMYKARNTRYRKEQFVLQKYLLDDLHMNPSDILMEHPILEYKKGFRPRLIAVADLFDKKNNKIYRLSERDNRGMDYEDQREKLEELGYLVKDIYKDSEWSWLWD